MTLNASKKARGAASQGAAAGDELKFHHKAYSTANFNGASPHAGRGVGCVVKSGKNTKSKEVLRSQKRPMVAQFAIREAKESR